MFTCCEMLLRQYKPKSLRSVSRRIKAVQEAKVGETQYLQSVPNKVANECVCNI